MSKQYGLIIPGQKKKDLPVATTTAVRPSIFNESSTDSDDDKPPQMKMSAAAHALRPGAMERRMVQRVQAKALAEDPTVYQYDELYDDMEKKRDEDNQSKSNEPRKPKYISRLLEQAERRKLGNELRLERQVQKEREAEGNQFKDKESFVTTAYRKKLETMRKLEEQSKRDDYLEAIGDVTKQKDLDGFYRHLYEQKLGSTKDIQPPILPNTTAPGDNEVAYKPIKSVNKQRAYRKRHTSDEDESAETSKISTLATSDTKKPHLQNNIDADSDFSIDSSASSDEDEDKKDKKDSKNVKNEEKPDVSTLTEMNPAKIALNLKGAKQNESKQASEKHDINNKSKIPTILDVEKPPVTPKIEPAIVVKPKKDKSEIWKKRTIGEVYDAAVKRYFERKAARNA